MLKWSKLAVLVLLVLVTAMAISHLTGQAGPAVANGTLPVPPSPWLIANGTLPVPPSPWTTQNSANPVQPAPWSQ